MLSLHAPGLKTSPPVVILTLRERHKGKLRRAHGESIGKKLHNKSENKLSLYLLLKIQFLGVIGVPEILRTFGYIATMKYFKGSCIYIYIAVIWD